MTSNLLELAKCPHPPSKRRTVYRGPLGCLEQCEVCGEGILITQEEIDAEELRARADGAGE